MRFRQSELKTWQSCALQAKFRYLEGRPGYNGSKSTFGTCIHHALEQYSRSGDVDQALKAFLEVWDDPALLGVEIDRWDRFTTSGGLRQKGMEIIRAYDHKQAITPKKVVFVEHPFLVPFGRHELMGTVDLGAIRQNHHGHELLCIEDWKTASTKPNRAELGLNTQFCADEQTEILTRRGWLRHDELLVGEDVLTFDQANDVAEWQPVTSVNVFPVNHQDLLLMEGQGHSSLTTMNHRWPVEHVVSPHGKSWRRERRITETADLTAADRVPCAAPVVNLPSESKWDDAFVELVGWFWTEGHWTQYSASLAQSESANSAYTQRIRDCLHALYGPPLRSLRKGHARSVPPAWREQRGVDCVRFYLNKPAAQELRAVVSQDKALAADFLSSLTAGQLRLLIDTSIAADGTATHGSRVITQRSKERLDMFQMACSLSGIRTSLTRYAVGGSGPYAGSEQWRLALLERRRHFVPAERPRGFTKTVIAHTGQVWCPQTRNGTWLARRNGFVYFTGNTCYIYASLQPEFWLGNPSEPGFPPVPNGEWWFEMLAATVRRGIWIHLYNNCEDLDVGDRNEADFARLYRLCNEIEKAIEHDVFVPTISGDSCVFCSYANGPCPTRVPTRDEWDQRFEQDHNSWL